MARKPATPIMLNAFIRTASLDLEGKGVEEQLSSASGTINQLMSVYQGVLKGLEEHGAAYTLIAFGLALLSVSLALAAIGLLGGFEVLGFTLAGSVLSSAGGLFNVLDKRTVVSGANSLKEPLLEVIGVLKKEIEFLEKLGKR